MMNPLQTIVSREAHACFTQLSEQDIILIPNQTHGNMYHFNESAADLWLMLETPKTILELSEILAQKYLGSAEDYQQDILEWVNDTENKGLLEKQQHTSAPE